MRLESVPVSSRLRTTISSGANRSMTYGECEVTIAWPIVLVTKSTIRRCVCGGRAISGSSIAKITEPGPRRSAM